MNSKTDLVIQLKWLDDRLYTVVVKLFTAHLDLITPCYLE